MARNYKPIINGIYVKICALACVSFISVNLFLFQNCEPNKSNSRLDSNSQQQQQSDDNQQQQSESHLTSYGRGAIAFIDEEGSEINTVSHFSANSNVIMKLAHFHPSSNQFKWTITRGFEIIANEITTNSPTYKHRLTQMGVYNVFVQSYNTGNAESLLTQAAKRVVIGEACSPPDILEIELQSGSLSLGSLATLTLQDASLFSSVQWRMILPSQEIIISEGSNTRVDLSSLSSTGTMTVEVAANPTDPTRSQCLTYRKKELQVSKDAAPYFNPSLLLDSNGQAAEMSLENNDIYKYDRSSSYQYIEVNIVSADTCSFQIDHINNQNQKEKSRTFPINCSNGRIDINLAITTTGMQSVSETECQEFKVIVTAVRGTLSQQQSYYGYCPQDESICFFGTDQHRPSHHTCQKKSPSLTLSSESKQIHGVCNNTIVNRCQSGVLNDVQDTDTHDQWQCLGQHGGRSATCQKVKSINGVCNNEITNRCQSGLLEDVQDTDTHYRWQCKGQHGGRSATDCQKTKPINGVCSQTNFSCLKGRAINSGFDPQSQNIMRWSCEGLHGGTDVSCQWNTNNGLCGHSQKGHCLAGTPQSRPDSNGYHKWDCIGQNGGTSATNCQISISANGHCNNTVTNGCLLGTLRDIQDSATHYKWQCVGQNGQNVDNCQKRKAINGACDNSRRNGCSAGQASSRGIASTANYYRWQCLGQYGGNNANNCQKAKLSGNCSSTINGCTRGTLVDVQDTANENKWNCQGPDNGPAVQCSKAKIHGVCNNNVQNGCATGRPNANAIADTNTYYKWHCEGQDQGRTATNCQKRKAINGACDNSRRNGCSAGQANANAVADTTQYYRWQCVGQHGGTSVSTCQKAKLSGNCSSTINGCTRGTLVDVQDTANENKWNCQGPNNGPAVQCSKAKIHGVCNNNVQNGCATGRPNANAIADTNTYYKWHCEGQDQGRTATNCQKRKAINGACDNSRRNGCSAGQANANAVADTTQYYRWQCVGQHGGTSVSTCQKAKLSGNCSSTINGCTRGTLVDVQDTANENKWNCQGPNNGPAVQCSKAKIHGVCNNNVQNGCATGRPNANAIADTNTYYKWHCEGQDQGRTATNCQKRKAINGACDNSRRNGCRSGQANANAVADTTQYYRWQCVGQHGGTSVSTCQKAKLSGTCSSTINGCTRGTLVDVQDTADENKWNCQGPDNGPVVQCSKAKIHGVCNNNVQNGCTTGRPNANAIADTNTYYKWHCEGQDQGRTATNCQKRKAINGACDNSRRNGCRSGQANANAVADTTQYYRWQCVGQHGGTSVSTCQKAKLSGTCSNTINSCTRGTLVDVQDTVDENRWNCQGPDNGPAVQCSKAKIHGVCNNNVQNGCTTGRPNANAIADTNTYYKWHCEGQDQGRTATNCQKRKAINGACDNSRRNGCSAGQASSRGIASTANYYRWQCLGQYGGNNANNCQKAKLSGTCSNTINSCTRGTLVDVQDTADENRWNCQGPDNGPVVQCSKAKIHGVCNNSVQNGCATGRPSANAIADTNTYYKWHCEGQDQGRTATNCQKRKAINGACDNSRRNGCSAGQASSRGIASTANYYRWQCLGQYGGNNANNCQKAKLSGNCSNTINSCTRGTLVDVQDTADENKWNCQGPDNGPVVQCSKAKIHGVCNNNVQNGCATGRPSANAIADTETHHRWHCVGQYGGTTADNCQKLKPINGVCNNNVQNGCTSGQVNDDVIADTETHHRWHCVGQHGGTTANNCQKLRPINGVCNNNILNRCQSGLFKDIQDTRTHYKWQCEGQHEGISRFCQKPITRDGVCNNNVLNRCQSGLLNDTQDNRTHYKWQCVGQHGGRTQDCEKRKPVNGICNKKSRGHGCLSGAITNVSESNGYHRWQCRGFYEGTTVRCERALECRIHIFTCIIWHDNRPNIPSEMPQTIPGL